MACDCDGHRWDRWIEFRWFVETLFIRSFVKRYNQAWMDHLEIDARVIDMKPLGDALKTNTLLTSLTIYSLKRESTITNICFAHSQIVLFSVQLSNRWCDCFKRWTQTEFNTNETWPNSWFETLLSLNHPHVKLFCLFRSTVRNFDYPASVSLSEALKENLSIKSLTLKGADNNE